MDIDRSVSLSVGIIPFFMTSMMLCYAYEIENELVVGWLEDELMRVLRFFVVSVVRGGCLGYD